MSADLVRAAIAYSRRALPVLPLWWTAADGQCACGKAPGDNCKPGKHPLGALVPNGVKGATLDQRTIANWWRRYPPANVAIATGGTMRLLVVDVDPDAGGRSQHGGARARARRHACHRRGDHAKRRRHLYMLVPGGRPLPTISAGKLGAGIDHRCQGGYVAAPPSAVAGKGYAWSVDSAARFATAPDWLLEALATKRSGNGKATDPEEWARVATAPVEEGARNHTIARVAGLLLRRLPAPILAAELVACFNAVKCQPPLEPAELKTILDSIADMEMGRRGLTK